MSEVENLSDREAITAVRLLVAHWAEARGREALVASQAISQAAGSEQLPAPLLSLQTTTRRQPQSAAKSWRLLSMGIPPTRGAGP